MLRGQSLNSRGGAGGCQGQNISHETKFRFSDFFGQQTKKPSFFHKFYKNFSFENCRVRILHRTVFKQHDNIKSLSMEDSI
jgi:hypothetical protein